MNIPTIFSTMHQKLAFLLLALMLALPCTVQASADLQLQSIPDTINIDATYNGATLQVTGQIPSSDELILRFTGEPTELHMRVKGKVFNLLWMNVDKIVLDNVPSVLLVESSSPLENLGQAVDNLHLEGVRNSITIQSGMHETIDATEELIHLKQSEHLYNEQAGNIEFGQEGNGMRSFTAKVHVPSRLKPGHYTLEAYSVHQGTISGKATRSIEARLTGIPAWLAHMAFDNGTLYGILAVIIALLGGLAIGLVFQSKGAH